MPLRRAAALVMLALLAAEPSHAASVILVPQADNTLYEDPLGTISNGAGVHIFAGVIQAGQRRRALIRFDTSSIPAGSIISDAHLELTLTRSISGDAPVTIHRLLGAFGEGASNAGEPGGRGTEALAPDATWTLRFFGSPASAWSTPGGDFEPSPLASTVVGDLQGPYTWTSPALIARVQSWVDAEGNDGLIVLSDESGFASAKRFGSRESATPPRLTVTFTPPCQGDYDSNGSVSFADITFVLANYGNPFNFNAITVVLANFGAACN